MGGVAVVDVPNRRGLAARYLADPLVRLVQSRVHWLLGSSRDMCGSTASKVNRY